MHLAQPQTTQVTFRQQVAAGTGAIIVAEAPIRGKIIEVTFHFPDGCNALVEVAFKCRGGRFPTGRGFLALNNATPTFRCSIPVYKWERLEVEVRNTDAINAHTPSVTGTIEGYL